MQRKYVIYQYSQRYECYIALLFTLLYVVLLQKQQMGLSYAGETKAITTGPLPRTLAQMETGDGMTGPENKMSKNLMLCSNLCLAIATNQSSDGAHTLFP